MSRTDFSRRRFLTGAATVGAASTLGIGTLASCAGGGKASESNDLYGFKSREYQLPPMLDTAPDGPVLKAGIIGCGGRGSGAAINFLDAGPNLTVTAIGDVFQDRVTSLQEKLKNDKGVEVADENCFVGFDAFEKVIDSGVDVVILATPRSSDLNILRQQ